MGRIKKDNVPFTRRTKPEFIPIIDAFIKQLELNDGMVSFQGYKPEPEPIPVPEPKPIEPPVSREGLTPASFLRKIGKGYLITEAVEEAEPENKNNNYIQLEENSKQDEEPIVTIDDLPDEIRSFLSDSGTYDFLTLKSRNIVDSSWFRLLYQQLLGTANEKQKNFIIQQIYNKIQEIGE